MATVDINPQTTTVTANRKLRKSGGSVVVSIPRELIQSLDWEIGDDLRLEADWSASEMKVNKS